MKPLLAGQKFQLDRRLGGGSFGEVYEAHDVKTGQEVALKLEYDQIDPSHLETEVEIYKALAGGKGIPWVFWYGYDCNYRVMAFELLGPNLEDLLNYCGRRLSLKSVLMLADQLLSRFQYIHSKGYIHRDIKPDNILMGLGRQGNTVYVTDIGLGKEIAPREGHTYPFVGTVPYASITAHMGNEQYPRDDMESLGYVLIYLLQGTLPWLGINDCSQEEQERQILAKKQATEQCGLFEGIPIEFKSYFELVRSPKSLNYASMRRLFRSLFDKSGFKCDNVFDWTELKFLEALNERNISK